MHRRIIPFLYASIYAAALMLAAHAVHGSPVEQQEQLHPAVRVANFDDVAHTFESAYKFSPQCPQKIEIAKIQGDFSRNIARVLLSDIKEDGIECKGEGTDKMYLVSEATVKAGDLLKRLGFNKAFSGLQQNRAALATVQNSNQDSSLLVGFDEGQRVCGASTYSSKTFWFFIREGTKFAIIVRTGQKQELTRITLPPGTRALFLSDGERKLCLLYDKSTTNSQEVVVQAQNAEGSPVPVGTPPPTPTPSSSIPAASPSVAPASPSSSTSPKATQAINASAEATPTLTPSVSPTPSIGATDVTQTTDSPSSVVVTPTPQAGGRGSVCFPSHARVELESGIHVPISSLRLGDRVRTAKNSFSDVFMFTHREANTRYEFVRLTTAARASITLTASHYIYASGKLKAAGSIGIGDLVILGDGRTSPVSSIEIVTASGLYNPHTLSGDIVVDGVLTSTYTTAVHPVLAHSGLLAPLRALYARVGAHTALDKLACAIGTRAASLAKWAPSGPASV